MWRVLGTPDEVRELRPDRKGGCRAPTSTGKGAPEDEWLSSPRLPKSDEAVGAAPPPPGLSSRD